MSQYNRLKSINIEKLFPLIKGKRIRIFTNEELTGIAIGYTGLLLVLKDVANITFSRVEPDTAINIKWIKKIEFQNKNSKTDVYR